MISALEWNLNHGQRNLRLFEIGREYELRDGEPVETPVLTLGATGLAREKTMHEERARICVCGFERRPGSHRRAGRRLRVAGGRTGLAGGRASGTDRATGEQQRAAGVAGQLARRIADQLKLRQDIFIAEMRLEPLLKGIEAARAGAAVHADPAFSGRRTGFFAGAFRRDYLRASGRGDSRLWAFRNCRASKRRTCFAAGKCQRGNFR